MSTTAAKTTVTAALATGFAAALLGLAAPASADVDHQSWIQNIQQHATTSAPTVTFGDGR